MTFRSIHHPEGAPAALVYGRALARPLLFCATPVMLGALAAALQGGPVLRFLWIGLPAALLAATAWTHFRLGRTLAEIHVREDAAALRTVAACLWSDAPPAWQPVHDLRVTDSLIQTSIGHQAYELPRAEWPNHEVLLQALKQARSHTRRIPAT